MMADELTAPGDLGRDDLLTRTRGALYRYLSGAFLAAPTAQAIEAASSAAFGDALEHVAPGALPAHAELRDRVGDAEAVRRDHMELFRVPLGRYLPPFEAVHRDEREVDGEPVRGLLMGPSTASVSRYYAAAGAALGPGVDELPDHVGLELGFMAFLCDQEVEAAAAGDAEGAELNRRYQAAFVHDHLVRWVPEYCGILRERAESAYYRALAAILAELCRSEHARLGDA